MNQHSSSESIAPKTQPSIVNIVIFKINEKCLMYFFGTSWTVLFDFESWSYDLMKKVQFFITLGPIINNYQLTMTIKTHTGCSPKQCRIKYVHKNDAEKDFPCTMTTIMYLLVPSENTENIWAIAIIIKYIHVQWKSLSVVIFWNYYRPSYFRKLSSTSGRCSWYK